MKARAPGKVVLSGAYAVLEGAPAIVAAVDRYVIADGARAADRVTDEVAAAVRRGDLPRAVWFDAAALRASDRSHSAGGRKLGLGSSAAIVVASLGASLLSRGPVGDSLADAVFWGAFAAHREAQRGGSGVDVAASAYGGVLRCRRESDAVGLKVERTSLPPDLVVEVYAAGVAASTRELLSRVSRLQRADPRGYASHIARATEGAEQSAAAVTATEWIVGARTQWCALQALGGAAGAPIVTPAMEELNQLAEADSASFGPSGAGGGDVAFYAGPKASSARFRARALEVGLCPMPLRLGARGLHSVVDDASVQ